MISLKHPAEHADAAASPVRPSRLDGQLVPVITTMTVMR
jgi:hypothetical protein